MRKINTVKAHMLGQHSRQILCLAFAVLVVASCEVLGAMEETIPQGDKGFESHIGAFFKMHCLRCHGPAKSKADVTLHELGGDFTAGGKLELWERILEMLKSGEMPPENQRQPDGAKRRAVIKWIEAGLRSAIAKDSRSGTSPTTRRLTNFEYQNTMRDLLGFELDLIQYLPKDPAKPYRFNNTAKYLLMGREQIERYEQNAKRAMASAIVDLKRPKVQKVRKEWGPKTRRKTNNEIAVSGNRRGTPGDGVKITSWPSTGEYRIRVKASARFPKGTREMPLRLVMGYRLAGDVGSAPFQPVGTIKLVDGTAGPQVYEFRGRIENHPWENEHKARRGGTRTGNLRTIAANMVITPQNLFDDGTLNDSPDPTTKPRALVDWIEFEAPVVDVWPPSHHTRILFKSPLRKRAPEAYVREVLRRFMTRAFRRPANDQEVKRYARIYKIYSAGSVTAEEAMRETLAVVLTSPNFLYHTIAEDDTYRQFETASRLSYFLWGSMPDQQLFDLAKQNKLRDSKTIADQVRRMLEDRRSDDFVRNFVSQWLSIDKARTVPINLKLFPRFLHTVKRGERRGAEVPFRPTIRDDMCDETTAFVAELIKRNASVLNIVDSDFAMLNGRLAAHYRVDGVEGHELRPVPIKREHRLGGLLTHGSVLIGNSTGSAPHPIYRAVWLREAILGDEVKDPPADVPALVDSPGKSAEQASTIKDILRKHRRKESCRDCHARLDPWGIPFERYNAVGRYQPSVPKAGVRVRGFDRKAHRDLKGYNAYLSKTFTVKVNAASQLPRGPKVDGLEGLKRHLLEDRKDDIARNVTRRLLAYALGRELTYRDRFAVEALLERAKKNDYKFRDMLIAICLSDVFLGEKKR